MLISSSQKTAAMETEQPSLLSLLTFSPVGNPLDNLSTMQRQFFFNSLFRMLQFQNAENEERVRNLTGKMLPPVSAAVMAVLRASGREKTREDRLFQKGKAVPFSQSEKEEEKLERAKERIREMAGGKQPQAEGEAMAPPQAQAPLPAAKPAKKFLLPAKKKPVQPAQEENAGGMGSPLTDSALREIKGQRIEEEKAEFLRRIVFKARAQDVERAQLSLAAILNEYSGGDAQKAQEALSELSRRLEEQGYRADELGAVLLLVIEDQVCAGEEGDAGSARPGGSAARVQSLIPEKIRQTASQSAEIRLASVREMLRHYFMRHPGDLGPALAAALGMAGGDAADDALLQAKMESALHEIGAYALSQKILAAIKEQKKLDTKKCLLELGYRYDAKNKKLIIGKRTCGKPAEASGIIAALLSKFKKPKK